MSRRAWQDIPDWLSYDVRWHNAAAMTAGAARAGEDAIASLTEKLLRDDPGFASVVVARYVRSLVRAPKQRRRGKPGERERLLAECARLRAEGLSLRAIGERQGVSHSAVSKRLAEWDTRLVDMPDEIVRIATPLETRSVNPAAAGFTAQVHSDPPNVIALRRPA